MKQPNPNKRTAAPRYDEAFKTGAMKMVTEQQRSVEEVAQELGICVDSLKTWLKNAGALSQTAAVQTKDIQRIKDLETRRCARLWLKN